MSELTYLLTTCCLVLSAEIVMHDAYIGGCFWWTKITRKASDAADYNVLFSSSTWDDHVHDAYIGGHSENNIKCVMHDDLGQKPRHWLYEWFSQFHSCGTYSVLSRSHSIALSLSDSANTISPLGLHHLRSPVVVLALEFLLTLPKSFWISFTFHSYSMLHLWFAHNLWHFTNVLRFDLIDLILAV